MTTKSNRTHESEEELFEKSLREHAQLTEEDSPAPPDATHHVATDEEGRRSVERDRFSAI